MSMGGKLRVAVLLVYFCISSIYLFAYICCPDYLGMAEAVYDSLSGNYTILLYGDPESFSRRDSEYARRLRYDHKIYFMPVAECFIDLFTLHYAQGYNDVMRRAIRRKFNKDIDIMMGRVSVTKAGPGISFILN